MFTLINNFDLFEEVPMQTTADRIHDLMIEKGMSQADLMRATNASKGTVSKWLSGTNTPSGRFLLNLASALGTTGDFLLSGNTQNTGVAVPRGAKPQLMNPIQVDGLHHSPGMPLPEFARISQYPDGRIFVPIIGDATMGPDGFFEEYGVNSRYGDGYVQAPFNVSPYSYGLRGVGGCMHPAIRDGWLVIFDPEAQPMPTEYVHVCLKDGRQTIKEFIGLHDGILTLMAVNTGERITFKNDQVLGIATCVFIVSPSRRISELPEMDYLE